MNAAIYQGDYLLDLVVRPGETFRGRLKWVEENGTTPVVITGATPVVTLRNNRQDAQPAHTFDLSSGMSLDPANGSALLVIQPNKSSLFDRQFVFDYKLTLANGDAYFLAGGVVAAFPTNDSTRVEWRTAMTALIRARGPIEIPVSVGSTGPFDSIDLRAPSGAFFRISATAQGGLPISVGTGLNAVDFIELEKPSGGALRISASNTGSLPLTAVSVSASTIAYLDFNVTGGIVRMTATDLNTYALALL